jgi:hypothetical protein
MRKLAFVSMFMPVLAFAEVPTTVTTALTGAGTDAAVVGAAVLVVLVGIAAFKYIRKAL